MPPGATQVHVVTIPLTASNATLPPQEERPASALTTITLEYPPDSPTQQRRSLVALSFVQTEAYDGAVSHASNLEEGRAGFRSTRGAAARHLAAREASGMTSRRRRSHLEDGFSECVKEHPGRQVVDDLRAPGAMSRRLRGLGEAAAADAPAPAPAADAPAGGTERRGSGRRRPSITV